MRYDKTSAAARLVALSTLLLILTVPSTHTASGSECDETRHRLTAAGTLVDGQDRIVARTLDAVETSCHQQVRRVFLETPEGRRLILESRWIPGDGTKSLRLTDDGSGWWIELREKTGSFRVTSPDQFGDALWLQREALRARARGGTAYLTDSAGVAIEASLPTHRSPVTPLLHPALQVGLPTDWKPDSDPDLRRVLAWLIRSQAGETAAGRGSIVSEFTPLLEFVAGLLPEDQGTEPAVARYEATSAVTGREIGPEMEPWLARFETLEDAGDPLDGLRPSSNDGSGN